MEDNTGKWHWLVKLKAIEKVKHLIWLIFHGCLPTNTLRFKRRLTNNQGCPRCQFAVEDTWHCIRDCRRAWEVWQELGFIGATNFLGGNIVDWIIQQVDSDQGHLFLSALWWIWRQRNCFAFENHYEGDVWLRRNIWRMATDSRIACNLLPELLAIAKGLKALTFEIRELLSRDWTVRIEHTFRKANFCADFMAKFATSCDNGLMIWDEPPQGLQQLLLANIMGISFPRIV
ncbi:uncharacterized protein LOC127905130 [Populus trichocarpa]|uniref:uncharacterized protein LOC127905130 n=1 Tax=Populus trichocarpa TaxID=3694 RepID=UPI002278BE4E|nr:uncharacterized protein LOC127905130 [Populus trichocarpa]